MKRRILVTSALPYANGIIHLGHMVEHIQTDIWVRFQKMRGHECYYVCADDTHGTPVMLAAQRKGIAPEEMIAQVREEHLADFNGFFINYDNYYSTHSAENRQFSESIYNTLKNNQKISSRHIEQLYDEARQIFLPDRFVKGTCPKCGAADQYGDNCEQCGAIYDAAELKNPYSTISGSVPVIKKSEHFFFELSHCADFLRQWTEGADTLIDGRIQPHLQEESLNKMREWLKDGLKDWDISRDAPYFGFEIPDAAGKFFYVWLDAPIGYMASFKHFCDKNSLNFDDFFKKDSDCELVHFIGKDILYFHSLFWPATLHYSGYRAPTAVFAHGFLTVDGQKMSKSRGTFIAAKSYLDNGLNPEWLRYYIAAKLNGKVEDIDLSFQDFIARVNSDLIGKYINIAARAAGFIQKRFDGTLADVGDSVLLAQLTAQSESIAQLYEERDYARLLRDIMDLADKVNAYTDDNKPWELAKVPEYGEKLHTVCSELINAFKILSVYLAPVLPKVAEQVVAFLNLPHLQWADSKTTLGVHRINAYQHLMQRVEQTQIDQLIESNKHNMETTTQSLTIEKAVETSDESTFKPVVSFDDFSKLDLRVARVLQCEKVEGSTKLLKFKLSLGNQERTVFSGIAASYPEPEKLIGRNVIMVANFAPRKMAKFGMSEGMILSAADDQHRLFLLDVDQGADAGMSVG